MADPRVRVVGQVEDFEGQVLELAVDYDTVVLREPGQMGKAWRLESAAAGEFAQHFVSACWQAARQAGEMAAEAVRDG